MQPAQLAPEHFATYPPQAREVALRNLEILRQLPLGFVPLLLAEVIAYDSKFPAERQEVDAQFAFMSALSLQRRKEVMARFERLASLPALEEVDWVRNPGEFSERLSAHLWTTNQVADFRAAAVEFLDTVRAAIPPPEPAIPRLSDRGSRTRRREEQLSAVSQAAPARHLLHARESGRWPANAGAARGGPRRRSIRFRFGHWYIDGGIGRRRYRRDWKRWRTGSSIPSGTPSSRNCEACFWRARAPKRDEAR